MQSSLNVLSQHQSTLTNLSEYYLINFKIVDATFKKKITNFIMYL